jgi:hypothetical protein
MRKPSIEMIERKRKNRKEKKRKEAKRSISRLADSASCFI